MLYRLRDPSERTLEHLFAAPVRVRDQNGLIVVERADEMGAGECSRIKRRYAGKVLEVEYEDGARPRDVAPCDASRTMQGQLDPIRRRARNGGIRSRAIPDGIEARRACALASARTGKRRRERAPIDVAVAENEWRRGGVPRAPRAAA